MPLGLEQSSCTLEGKRISPSRSEGQEELGCRNGHVTRHEEEFHIRFKGKNIVDTGMQGKMGQVGKGRGLAGHEMNFVAGIKDVAKRSQGEDHRKNAAKNTGRRQKLRSNR